MPAAGHIPPRLGLNGMLEAGFSLAHASILLGAYFWPEATDGFRRCAAWLRYAAWLLLAASAIFLVEWAWSLARRRRGSTSWLAALGAAALVGGLWVARDALASYEWLGDTRRILGWTVAGFVAGGIALAMAADAGVVLRRPRSWWRRGQVLVGAVGALALALGVLGYWVPILHRSTPAGLRDLGGKVAGAGLWVQTTLCVEDTLAVREIPDLDLLDVRRARRDRQWAERWTPERIDLVRRGIPFFERVVGALHEAGVPLILGTDAMGFPMVVPGVSVHDEMRLLSDAGLSPYEILQAATVNPARFLGVADDVGMLRPGMRADLVVAPGDPLDDLGALRSPIGVMVRGRWLDRGDLRAGLARLSEGPPPASEELADAIESKGIDAAVEMFRQRLKSGPDPTLAPGDLNRLGYHYLHEGKGTIALRIFELNVEAFPQAWNPWDSLGEVCLADGNRQRAIASYRRSLELNPDNDNARTVLNELGVEGEN